MELEQNARVAHLLLPNGDKSFVLFHNTTNRTLNLYWSVLRKLTFHTSLGPGERCKTNTFTRHFWIFCDKETSEMMCVNKEKVFVPRPYHIRNPNNPNSLMPCRKEIKIHLPLYTLRESCLWHVVAKLHTVPEDIAMHIVNNAMEIPCILKCEIKKRLKRKRNTDLILAEVVQNVMERIEF